MNTGSQEIKTTQRGKKCKKCGADEWRRSLLLYRIFGFLSWKAWLVVMLVGLAIMIAAVFTLWSSFAIGFILFILGLVGATAHEWKCAACEKSTRRRSIKLFGEWAYLIFIALIIGFVVRDNFLARWPNPWNPVWDRNFTAPASYNLGRWLCNKDFRDWGMALVVRAAEIPFDNSMVRDDALDFIKTKAFINKPAGDLAVHEFVQAMAHEKSWVRAAALYRSWGTPLEVLPEIIKALNDESAIVRSAAAFALGLRGQYSLPRLLLLAEEATPLLLNALDDEFAVVRAAATSALDIGYMIAPSEVERRLIQALEDPSLMVRCHALEGLGNSRSPEVVRRVIQYMKKWQDEPDELLYQAVRLLGNMAENGSGDALAYLCQLIGKESTENRDIGIKRLAMNAVGFPGAQTAAEPLIRFIDSSVSPIIFFSLSYCAAEALGKIGSVEAVPSLIKLMGKDPRTKRHATVALGQIGSAEAVPSLLGALKDEDREVRETAVKALGKMRAPEAVPLLGELLRSAEYAVGEKEGAAEALGQIRAPEAAPFLVEASKVESPKVRKAALRALGALGVAGGPETLAHLVQAMTDKDNEVSSAAAFALGKIGGPDAFPHLIQVLKEKDHPASRGAAAALGEIGNPEGIPLLVRVVGEKDHPARASAIASLWMMEAQEAAPSLVQVLGEEYSRAASKDLLESDLFWQKLGALLALRTIGLPETVPAVIDTIRREGGYHNLLKDNAFATLSGKLFPHVPFDFVEENALDLTSALSNAPDYSEKLLSLICLVSRSSSKGKFGLFLLEPIHKRDMQKDNYSREALLDDLHSVEKHYAIGPHAYPILDFFIAYLLKEKGHFNDALQWSEKAFETIPQGEAVPLRIALRWVMCEARLRLGQFEDALKELAAIENGLLPKVTGMDRRLTDLPFNSYTAALRGIVLSSMDRSEEAVLCLYDSEKQLKYETEVPEETVKRLTKIILAYRANAQSQSQKKDAEGAIRLAEEIGPLTILDQDAEEVALNVRIRAAVGEGDYETAHELTDKLALKKSAPVITRGIQVVSTDKKKAFDRIKAAQDSIEQLDQEIVKAEQEKKEDQAKNFRKSRRAKQRNLKRFIVSLKKTHPEIATLVGAEPIEVSILQDRIADGQAIVQYLVLDERTYIFVVTPEDIRIRESAVGRVDLGNRVRQFRMVIAQEAQGAGGADRELRERTGRELSKLLIEPVLADLNGARHLVIIPNGELHLLPFGALTAGGRFLAQGYTLSYLSASSLMAVVTREVSKDRNLLAIANPANPAFGNLEGAEREVAAIAALFPEKQVFTREKAKKDLLVGKDLRNRYLHLSMHGQAGSYEDTRLILADGFLTVPEIWGLYLDGSPLVVLSACETSLGERIGGDEVVSLANGFIFAGAGCVVSSLWNVADAQTAELMRLFYASMADGRSHAEALALAKREMIRRSDSAPYFWSGFMISGL